jgi:hypothetical protein
MSAKVAKKSTGRAANPAWGRQKGTPNKNTAQLRDMILEALERRGGVDYLAKVADKPFCALLARVIPLQVGGDPENPLQIILDVTKLNDNDLLQLRRGRLLRPNADVTNSDSITSGG